MNVHHRRVIFACAVLLIILCCWAYCKVEAGEVRLTWNASENADGYKVYHGTSSRVYGEPQDAGPALEYQFPPDALPNGCVLHYFAATAYNTAGESDYSVEAVGYPRPIIGMASRWPTPDAATHLRISGDNFADGVVVYVDGAIVTSAERLACNTLHIPVALIPGQPGPLSFVLKLCNNGPDATCADKLIQSPAAPANLTVR